MFILDWIDDNFTIAGPIGAVVGLAIAVVIALVAQQIGYRMNKCVDCNTDNNIVHSGVDAFALGVMDLVGSVCYGCANTRLQEKEWESYLKGTLIQKVGSDPYFSARGRNVRIIPILFSGVSQIHFQNSENLQVFYWVF